MKHTVSKKTFITIVTLTIILCGVFIIAWAVSNYQKSEKNEEKDEKKEGTTFKEFLIQVKSASYSPVTQSGIIELSILNTKDNGNKLLPTRDDLDGKGNVVVGERDHLVQIYRGEAKALVYASEQGHSDNRQDIIITYLMENKTEDTTAKVQIHKFAMAVPEVTLSTPKDVVNGSITLTSRDGVTKATLSECGFIMDYTDTTSKHLLPRSEKIEVFYTDKRSDNLIPMDNTDMSGNALKKLQITFLEQGTSYRHYCMKFERLQEIEKIWLMGIEFYPD